MTSSSVSSSSSQISRDSSSSSLLPTENENYESQKYDIFENLFDSDSDSGRDEISEHPQRDTLQMALDFFTEFDSMPDIDAVSEDIENEPEITIPPTEFSKIKSQDKDLGYFVDPLTGDRLFSAVNVTTQEIKDPGASETKAFDSNETLESINEDAGAVELSDLDITLDLVEYTQEKDQDLNKNIEEDKTLEQFLEIKAIKPISTEDNENIKWEAIARAEEAKCLQRNVMDLVDEIIRKAIQTSEYISPEALRRQHLDKRKLMREILDKVQESEVEKRVRQFLNQKCVDFYRRKKKFRPIMPDNKKSLQIDMKNYSQAIKRLDEMLSKELQTKERAMQMKQELETQLNNAKNKCQEAIADFEDLVRTNLMRDDRPKCNMLIEKLLSRMDQCRREVSEVRYELILKQHIEATLKEKLSNIEDLGNGLTMKDYDNLQNVTQILGKKLEERNVEWQKLHLRVHRDVHLMAHFKERQKMLRNSVKAQRLAFDELMNEKQTWRRRIGQLRVKRDQIRRAIKELSFKTGILDKPALMMDYDQTCKMLEEHHNEIEHLKDSIQMIEEKLDRISKSQICNRLSYK